MREALCQRFYAHVGRKAGEIFVSDGSKCDIGRLQMMFGAGVSVAVQARHAPFPIHVSFWRGRERGCAGAPRAFSHTRVERCALVSCACQLWHDPVSASQRQNTLQQLPIIRPPKVADRAGKCRTPATPCTWIRRSSWA